MPLLLFGAMKMIMVVVMTLITAAMGGKVYRVGDSAGWTNIGHVDYKTWASTKLFRVGDNIVFIYNKEFHNVARVTYNDFLACNGTAPYSTFTSGNDTFPIIYPGHYFFICTFPGHCEAGQKVDIRVPQAGGDATQPPIPVGSPAPIEPLPFPYPPPPISSPSPVPHPTSQSPALTSPKESPSTTPPVSAPEIAAAPPKSAASQLAFACKLWTTVMAIIIYLVGFSF